MKLGQTQLECITEISEVLRNDGIGRVEKYYGRSGEFPQDYHHAPHTAETVDSVVEIAELALKRGKIEPVQVPILVIAAAFLDAYYDPVNKTENELKSADIALSAMSRFTCFDSEHYDMVKRYIMATAVKEFYPRLVQNVDPNDYAQGIIADADLHYFGRTPDVFIPRAEGYLKELRKTQGQKPLPFLMNNCVLLENHVWNTVEAEELYPHTNENIQALHVYQTRFAVQ